MSDHDTHRGRLRADGTVVALCGARFPSSPIVPGGPALRGDPPDPDQICPECLARPTQTTERLADSEWRNE